MTSCIIFVRFKDEICKAYVSIEIGVPSHFNDLLGAECSKYNNIIYTYILPIKASKKKKKNVST